MPQLIATRRTAIRREPAPTRQRPQSAAGPVHAVVLNYGTPHQTWLAVRSLQTSFTPPSSIVVVDNGSPDDSVAVLRRLLEGAPSAVPVTMIEAGRNLGFSGGCNLGIRGGPRRGRRAGAPGQQRRRARAGRAAGARCRARRRVRTPAFSGRSLLSREEPDRIVVCRHLVLAVATGRMRHHMTGRPASAAPVDAVRGDGGQRLRHADPAGGLRAGRPLRRGTISSRSRMSSSACGRGRPGSATMCVPAARAYHEGGALDRPAVARAASISRRATT